MASCNVHQGRVPWEVAVRTTVCLVAVLICIIGAGCSSSQPSTLPEAPTQHTSARRNAQPAVHVIYSFRGGDDGALPQASLIFWNGTFYGTTVYGGTGHRGTVFTLTKTGIHHVLHSFHKANGAYPEANVIVANGKLFGTTYGGGGDNVGTVFSLTTSGSARVLYSFTGDGTYPMASLIATKTMLYGTTYWGGSGPCIDVGCGTIFSVDQTTGAAHILYNFRGDSRHAGDGDAPQGNMIVFNGEFYGTALGGGAYNDGAIFRFDPATGRERVVYSFHGGSDGAQPGSGVIAVGNALYGTTWNGGKYNGGTVFRFGPNSHTERVIYSFGQASDGGFPAAGLVSVRGTLYGTTKFGGIMHCRSSGTKAGCGIVFALTPNGKETVLHEFGLTPGDGRKPAASLIEVNGTLYGTTVVGGTYHRGTVFALRVP